MSTRYARRARERRRPGCLGIAVGLVWLLVIAVACYGFVLRPFISRYVGDRIAQQVGGAPQEQSTTTQGQIEQQAGQMLPTVVAALPPGEIVFTEQQTNQYLSDNRASFAPLDSVTVRFVPGQVQTDLSARGFTGTVTFGLEAQNGRLVVVNPQMSGLLSEVISVDQVAQVFSDRLNNQLAAQGKSAQSVSIEQGRVVVVIG